MRAGLWRPCSLSHEATIVVLDGDHRGGDSSGIRDPFAASFGGFAPNMHLPEQRGFSSNNGGENPFASLAQAHSPTRQQAPSTAGNDGERLCS